MRRGTISQVTSSPASAQHLRDLALLRRVRDRIDREYAQPLRAGAGRAAVRHARLRVPRPGREHGAHPGAALSAKGKPAKKPAKPVSGAHPPDSHDLIRTAGRYAGIEEVPIIYVMSFRNEPESPGTTAANVERGACSR
jgi:hypothetical protein